MGLTPFFPRVDHNDNCFLHFAAGSILPDLRNIPRDKTAPAYMQWLARVNKESAKEIEDGNKLRIVRTCARHLEVSRVMYV